MGKIEQLIEQDQLVSARLDDKGFTVTVKNIESLSDRSYTDGIQDGYEKGYRTGLKEGKPKRGNNGKFIKKEDSKS